MEIVSQHYGFEIPAKPTIDQHRGKDLRRYSIVPIRAVNDRRLRPAAMRCLLAVCTYANRVGLCWPSHENLGNMLGVSRPAISRQLKILRSLGYIQKVKNHSWGKTAQILRVIYDENLSTEKLLESTPFEDKPPTHQAWELRKQQDKMTPESVTLTPKEVRKDELVVEDCVRLWKVSCSAANISRVITSEDLASLQQLQAAGVSFGAFEAAVKRVFEDWRQYRREPPHRLSYFLRLASTN